MNAYLIAATKEAMARNEGVEIMASSSNEALGKYEIIEGACVPDGAGMGKVWVRHPDGEERAGFIESLVEVKTPVDDDDDDYVSCPNCDCRFHRFTEKIIE